MKQPEVPPLELRWSRGFANEKTGETTLHSAWWKGEYLAFHVCWQGGRVYFALAEGRSDVCATLDECREEDAIQCWEAAMENERFGVCLYASLTLRHCLAFHCHVIAAANGDGLIREWWSSEWFSFSDFDVNSSNAFSGQRPAWPGIPHRYRGFEDVCEKILQRSVSDAETQLFPFSAKATKQDFDRAVNYLWAMGAIRFQQDKNSGQVYCSTHHSPYQGTITLGSTLEWNAHPELRSWLQEYFFVSGAQWKKTHYGRRKLRELRAQQPRLRLFFEPHFIRWICSFERDQAPSFHEQLEARLELREWLRDKVSAEQIENWLQT